MSLQFGRWNFDGQPVSPGYLNDAMALTRNYFADCTGTVTCGSLGMYFRSLCITRESRNETQPSRNVTGVLLTWDGRLDNSKDLAALLHLPADSAATDASIVLAAYEQLGTACFAELLGDWALALWDPAKATLFLAKDFIGTRHLYYRFESHGGITWSTVLDALVKPCGRPFDLNEEFVAGYLSTLPGADVTPYVGINAVPASTFVQVTPVHTLVQEYWQLDSSHHIRYKTDTEYEEHFRQVFFEAVRRRLRTARPVLAELSGGMDSTSIVCVADGILSEGQAESPRLDTVSYYHDDEPNWNERPYFALVEAQRGRQGYHLNAAATDGAFEEPEGEPIFLTPGFDALAVARSREFRRCVEASDSRVVLSGLGGDEVTGGVPTAVPEMQDLLISLHFADFCRKLVQFGLAQRCSLQHLCFGTLEEFLPQPVRRMYADAGISPWLTRSFVEQNREVFWRDAQRKSLFGPRPSFQESISALERLRRMLCALQPNPIALHRTAYPYLDRDLLTFLFAVPRDQHVRPGQRRSLLRRALAGVVPREIFARRRKAYMAKHSVTLIQTSALAIENLLRSSCVARAGWVQEERFRRALLAARSGRDENLIPLKKTLTLELWLRVMERLDLVRCRPWQSSRSRTEKALFAPETGIQLTQG